MVFEEASEHKIGNWRVGSTFQGARVSSLRAWAGGFSEFAGLRAAIWGFDGRFPDFPNRRAAVSPVLRQVIRVPAAKRLHGATVTRKTRQNSPAPVHAAPENRKTRQRQPARRSPARAAEAGGEGRRGTSARRGSGVSVSGPQLFMPGGGWKVAAKSRSKSLPA